MRALRSTSTTRRVVTSLACTVALGATALASETFRVTVQDPAGNLNDEVTVTYRADGGQPVKATLLGNGVHLIQDLDATKVTFEVDNFRDGTHGVTEVTIPDDGLSVVELQMTGSHLKPTLRGFATLANAGEVGGFSGGVTCSTGVYCQLPDQMGHGAGGTLAATSDTNPNAGFRVADNFQALETGSISNVCWWGVYLNFSGFTDCNATYGADDFTITYYDDSAGGMVPGAVVAGPFSVTPSARFDTGNDIVAGGGTIIISEYQFEASHPPVAVTNGDNYWVEITNSGTAVSCFWLWSAAPPGDMMGAQDNLGYAGTDYDLAWCVDIMAGPPPPPPPAGNDACMNATAIMGQGMFPFDNSQATEDGLDDPLCDFFGSQSVERDVWFCWTADCTGTVRLETCGQTTVDTKIAVYDGCACPAGTGILACNDDDCGLQTGLTFNAVSGQSYLVRVGVFPGAMGGTGTFSTQCISVPSNDLCANAIPVAVGSTTPGTTNFATTDTGAPLCGTSVTSPGVWYTVTGTGNTMTASLCNGATAYDSKVSVYCGDCSDLTGLLCLNGNDDFCGLQSQTSWCSQAGATYRILVHGFGGQTGDFQLTVTDSGMGCTATVACLPQGACCLELGGGMFDCVVTTAADCMAQGGLYAGDDTRCPSITYVPFNCPQGFENIANSGTPLNLTDDSGVVVPIGFTFSFFGTDHTNVAVCSNGYLTFGADLTDFSNDPIPTDIDPNDIICPLWDDFNPAAGGQVYSQTTGVAPNRAFIAMWSNVPQFANTDSNTFQVILFENGSRISFRYGPFTPEAFAGDYTVGVENAAGDFGISIDPTTLAPGSCVLLLPDTLPGDCTTPAPLDVKPGFCPNFINPADNGLVSVTLPGTSIAASMVDMSTVRLRRPGVGAPVAPYRRTAGGLPGTIGDVTSPNFGQTCIPGSPDQIDDVTFDFRTTQLADLLQLNGVTPGTAIDLELTGMLTTGQAFVARDTVVIHQGPSAINVRVRTNLQGALMDLDPQDVYGDGAGFVNFVREYTPGELVTINVPTIPAANIALMGISVNGNFVTTSGSHSFVAPSGDVTVGVHYVTNKVGGRGTAGY